MIFAHLQLARRLERLEAVGGARFVEARRRVTPDSRAEWVEIDGAYAMFDGAGSPVTQTFGLGLFAETSPAGLERIEDFFRERGAPVCHEVSPLAGVQLAETLSRRGYRPVEFTSVMYRPLDPGSAADRAANPRVRTRLMGDGEAELWSRVSARGWEQPALTEFLLGLGRVSAAVEGSLHFFADLDGVPAGAAVLRCHEGVGLLAGACTVPEARNRGVQQALLDARLRTAAARGCDLAMMCAGPGTASQRNAERHGFRIAYTRIKWQLDTSTTGS